MMTKKIITQEQMNDFLNDDKITMIEGLSGNSFLYYYQLFKVDLNDHFYIIYMATKWFKENKIFIPEKIEVCGYIKKSNKHLYNPNYYLREILDSINKIPCIQYSDFEDLNFNNILSKEFTKEIKNNWENLKNEKYKNCFTDMEYVKNTRAKEKALKWIVEDHLDTHPEYQYNIKVEMMDDDYIDYLSNPHEYIQNKIKNFMKDENRLSLLFESIITYEAAVHQMDTLLNNPDIQHERNMKDILNNIDAKTVTIKVVKDNKEWFGKIDTCFLKICKTYNYIPIYNCSKNDRDSFEKTFGSRADLYPEDIVEILFRNKTIYKKGE